MGQAGGLRLPRAGPLQPLGGVLAQEVVYPPGVLGGLFQQPGVHQPLQGPAGIPLVVPPDGHQRLQPELVAGKDPQPPQPGLVGRLQVVVTDVEGDDDAQVGPPGVLPLGQDLEPPGLQFGQQRGEGGAGGFILPPGDGAGAAGGQSQRQGDALHGLDDPLRRLRLRLQPLGGEQVGQHLAGAGRGQYVQVPDGLGRKGQVAAAAGDKQRAGGTGRDEAVQVGQVAAADVVQHHQGGRLPVEGPGQRVGAEAQILPFQGDAQGGGDALLDGVSIVGAAIEPEDTALEMGFQVPRGGDGQFGLADAADAAHADDGGGVGRLQASAEPLQFVLPAHQAGGFGVGDGGADGLGRTGGSERR